MSISIKDIKNQLAEFTYNLGNLCKSNKVNKWSFHKPINSPKMTQLSNSDYYAADDGFNLFTFNQPGLMMHELQSNNSTLWKYEERTSPFRLSDFWNYAHYANPMFQFEFVNNNNGTFGDTLRISCNTDIQNVVNNWSTPAPLSSTGDFVFLVFQRGKQFSGDGYTTTGIYKVCQLMNMEQDHINFKIPADSETGIDVGEYTLVPAITTSTYRLEDGQYWYYNQNSEPFYGQWFAFPPHAQINFTITQTSPSTSDYFAYFDVGQFYGVDFTYQPSNYELSLISFTNYIEYMPPSRTKQFVVTIEYYYTNCAQPVMLGQMSRTFNFDSQLETATINYRDVITTIVHGRLEEDIINIEQRVSITSLGETQTKTFARTIEKS